MGSRKNLSYSKTSNKKRATLFVARQVRTRVLQRATSLFNSFCSNVAKQIARFLLPFYPTLKADTHERFCSRSMLQAHFARVSTREGAFSSSLNLPQELAPNI